MSVAHSRILGCRTESTVRIRIDGRGLAAHCTAIREFTAAALDDGARDVHVELGECEYCDSTFVGTLLRLKTAAARAGGGDVRIVAPSPEADAVLRKMGLLRLFEVVDDASPEADWQSIGEHDTSSREFKENIVEAHRELADSSDDMKAIYESIAEDAAREMEHDG